MVCKGFVSVPRSHCYWEMPLDEGTQEPAVAVWMVTRQMRSTGAEQTPATGPEVYSPTCAGSLGPRPRDHFWETREQLLLLHLDTGRPHHSAWDRTEDCRTSPGHTTSGHAVWGH